MVHPSVPGNPLTLLDGLQALCAYELICGGQLSLINRLDRETSGIVLVAKNKSAARNLSKAMERREFRKFYHAIVWGWPDEDGFVIDGPLLRKGDVEPSPIWVKQMVHPAGKESRTRFEVECRFERVTTNGERFFPAALLSPDRAHAPDPCPRRLCRGIPSSGTKFTGRTRIVTSSSSRRAGLRTLSTSS